MQHRLPPWLCAVTSATLVVSSLGCSPAAAPTTVEQPEPYEVVVEPQQLEIAAGGAGTLQAQVNDTRGQPIGGAQVVFSPESPAATPDMLRVSETGRVTATGPSGRAAIKVTSGPRERLVPVLVKPGPPQRLEMLEDNPAETIAGVAFGSPLRVRVVDAFGNPIEAVTLTLTVATDDAGFVSVASDGKGVTSFDLPVLERAGRVQGTVGADADPSLSVAFELSVAAAPVAAIVPVTAPTDESLIEDAEKLELMLAVQDAFGNPVAAAVVDLSATAGSGSVEPEQVTTTADGLVQATWSIADSSSRQLVLDAQVVDVPTARYTLKLTKPKSKPKKR